MKEAHKFVSDVQQKATLRDIKGLGTEATRANIYEGLKKREYIVVKKNKILPTPLGEQLIDLVSPEMKNIAMTALLETRLEQVFKGEADPAPILKEYETSLKPAIDALFRSEPKLSVPIEIHKCPECQCNLTRITSKKTGKKYWVCTSETCKFIAPDKDGKPGPQKPKAEVHPETPCPVCPILRPFLGTQVLPHQIISSRLMSPNLMSQEEKTRLIIPTLLNSSRGTDRRICWDNLFPAAATFCGPFLTGPRTKSAPMIFLARFRGRRLMKRSTDCSKHVQNYIIEMPFHWSESFKQSPLNAKGTRRDMCSCLAEKSAA